MDHGLFGDPVFSLIVLGVAAVGVGQLPVNWVGFGLFALAIILFYLELEDPGLGIFGLGGLVSFVIASVLLFGDFSSPDIPEPSFRISPWSMGIASGIAAAILAAFFYAARTTGHAADYPGRPHGELLDNITWYEAKQLVRELDGCMDPMKPTVERTAAALGISAFDAVLVPRQGSQFIVRGYGNLHLGQDAVGIRHHRQERIDDVPSHPAFKPIVDALTKTIDGFTGERIPDVLRTMKTLKEYQPDLGGNGRYRDGLARIFHQGGNLK
ncbi:MAG: hypothetical protein IH809_02200 [Proteobacteria bacterium]|nr:hypothetical protein [Pseudomonadota bacterium]